jgi:hypothetical protein
MKLTIKTDEIEMTVEQDLGSMGSKYSEINDNFVNVIKNLIEKCSIESQNIINKRNTSHE